MASLKTSWHACDPAVKIVVPILSMMIAVAVLFLGEQRDFRQQIKDGDEATQAHIGEVEKRLKTEIEAVEQRTADRIGRVETQVQWLVQETLRPR